MNTAKMLIINVAFPPGALDAGPALPTTHQIAGRVPDSTVFEISELRRGAIRAWGTDAAAEARPPKPSKYSAAEDHSEGMRSTTT